LDAPKVDLAAAARISSRVEFRDIRLNEISASSPMRSHGDLEPLIQHRCAATKHEGDLLEVTCSYELRVKAGGDEVVKADLSYLVSYTLLGEDPVDQNDLEQFAFANGTYHSWPFVRQLLFDLTSRMGYPPYSLPVFKFFPKRPKAAAQPQTDGTPANTAGESKAEASTSSA